MTHDSPCPRVNRRRAVRQDRILVVAARAFARRGPEAVTLDEVADAVDVSKGTLYSHFPTKEALLVAIVSPALEAIERALGAITAEDAAGVVASLLEQWARLLHEHRDAMRVAHSLDTKLPRALTSRHRQVVSLVHRLLSQPRVAEQLRGSPEWAGMLIARLGLPLFEAYDSIDPSGKTFVEATSHLLLGAKR